MSISWTFGKGTVESLSSSCGRRIVGYAKTCRSGHFQNDIGCSEGGVMNHIQLRILEYLSNDAMRTVQDIARFVDLFVNETLLILHDMSDDGLVRFDPLSGMWMAV